MKIEFNMNLTPEALSACRAHGINSLQFDIPADSPMFLPGDMFSTETTMPLVFTIRRRHFHYVAADHLQVDLLLDL